MKDYTYTNREAIEKALKEQMNKFLEVHNTPANQRLGFAPKSGFGRTIMMERKILEEMREWERQEEQRRLEFISHYEFLINQLPESEEKKKEILKKGLPKVIYLNADYFTENHVDIMSDQFWGVMITLLPVLQGSSIKAIFEWSYPINPDFRVFE